MPLTQPRRKSRGAAALGVAAVMAVVLAGTNLGWAVPRSVGIMRPTVHATARWAHALPRTRLAAAFFEQAPAKDIDGSDFSFDQLKGKVTYAVNVASR